LLAIFLAAVILIAASVAVPRMITQARRAKEEEAVWRGEQYVRAIRLYYHKYGKFPRSIEDLSNNPANLHFLRKEYKDPMAGGDGSWRYIYVGPGGQLLGSLTRKLPIGMIPLGGVAPALAGNATNLNTSAFGTSDAGTGGSSSPTQTGGGAPGNQTAQTSNPATPPNSDTSGGTGMPVDATGAGGAAPAPVEPPKKAIEGASTLDSTVFGGRLVGIGSKIDRKSIRFYKGYGKYREWEFIWDPADDAAGLAPKIPIIAPGESSTPPPASQQNPGNPPGVPPGS